MALDIILRVPACAPVNEVADFIVEAEQAGFAGVGIPDTQLVTRDAFIALALAAERTSRIMLYPAVTNPITRHVSVIASLVRTIEELAPGRVHLMLGTGYSAVRTIGRRPATLASMRECTARLRQFLGGEELEFNGAPSHLSYASGEVPPIILTARGPRALALAGEIGDGVMANVALDPNTIAWGRSHVSQGASVSGRDVSPGSDFLEMFDISTHIAPTHEEALHQARHVCAHWVTQPALVNLLRVGGVEIPEMSFPPELLNAYPDLYHAEDQEAVVRLTSFLSDEMVEQICGVLGGYGTASEVAERLVVAAEQGVTRILIRTAETYSLPRTTLEAFRDVIFPRLNQLA